MSLWLAASSGAEPLDPQLDISGSLSFDTEVSGLLLAPATQSGEVVQRLATLRSSSAYADSTPPAFNPLAGAPTESGDGFGVEFHASHAADGGEVFTGSDIDFSITNQSANDLLMVTLRVDYQNQVSATGTPDAYASSEFFIEDSQGAERFVSAVSSFGGDGGGIASEAGAEFVFVGIAPGETETLHGDWTADALSAANTESASVAFDAFVSIHAVPEPQASHSLVAGTVLLAALARGSRPRSTRRTS